MNLNQISIQTALGVQRIRVAIFFVNTLLVENLPKMTNQSQGIQQLLAAEKKAADKVGEARKRKINQYHKKILIFCFASYDKIIT